jgi:hypothetical protein
MRYTLQDYSDVLFTGCNYKLPENTVIIINNLTKELGVVIAAAAAAVPDEDFKRSNLHYNNKRSRPDSRFKNKVDETWKAAPQFKVTVIEKKEGVAQLMNEIRACLNKISNKNYDQQRDAIFQWLSDDVQNENNSTTNIEIIAQSIFDIASSNKFYSELYAKLYRELIEKHEFFVKFISNLLADYYNGMDAIEIVDANTNYDLFCDNNKLNDRRKALSTFIVNLMKQQVLPKCEVLQLIINLQEKVMSAIDVEGKTEWIDEITENLFILVTLVAEDDTTTIGSIEDQVTTIRNNVDICSKYKAKEHKSISSRAIFKYMDMVKSIHR